MKVKSKGTVKELRKKVKIFNVGMDSGAYPMFRMNNTSMRIYVPFKIDIQIIMQAKTVIYSKAAQCSFLSVENNTVILIHDMILNSIVLWNGKEPH